MKVTIFGTGYVGLVTGAGLAEAGHEVLCVDVDRAKIRRLQNGEIPIYEPGLDELVERNGRAGRLRFTTDTAEAVAHGLLQFIAVGTPPDEDGSADLQYVLAVARSVAEHMDGYRVIVTKSTVPVGTAERVRETVRRHLPPGSRRFGFDVVSNPEFLKEGAAVRDFLDPDRIVIGSDSERARNLMLELYEPLNGERERRITMDICSAELTKYAANAALATKISFINELAGLAEGFGADIDRIREGIGTDRRIGFAFMNPGCGYGGSCFPKDVQALCRSAAEVDRPVEVLEAVERVNQRQKQVLFDKVREHYGRDLRGRTFAVWGLAFKPETDDMREAPARALMESLWSAGARVQAYDPAAMEECRRLYPEQPALSLAESAEAALEEADGLIICTEWACFRQAEPSLIRRQLAVPLVVDGRNLFDPEQMQDAGLSYYSVGRRPQLVPLDAAALEAGMGYGTGVPAAGGGAAS